MITINVSDREVILIQMAKKGFNLISLSMLVGVSHSYLSQVLNGKKSPSAKLAKNIAKELDLNVNNIFDFKFTTQ